MRKFKQNKLWRDKAVSFLESQGSKINWRQLSDEEFKTQLKTKLLEEVYEVIFAKNNQELTEELADVLEVLESLAKTHGIAKWSIEQVKNEKLISRGGFESRIFVESAEHPKNSFGEKYCLASPEKYPEII